MAADASLRDGSEPFGGHLLGAGRVTGGCACGCGGDGVHRVGQSAWQAFTARALEARYDGFTAGPLEELAASADVVVTATGGRHVVSARHVTRLADGCFLLNVGHGGDEIDIDALGSRREVIPFVEEARVGGRTVYLFAGGSMANLAAGQRDTLNSFDITMATMLAGLRYVLSADARAHAPGLHPLPRSAWKEVARRAAVG